MKLRNVLLRKMRPAGFVFAAALMLALTGCGGTAGNRGETGNHPASVETETAADTTEPSAANETSVGGNQAKPTRTITDSVGREVEIPSEIQKIAPSGSLAQIVLYTVCPDKLAGLATDFSDQAKEYIDQKYWGLPKFGQFYGKNANLNMEALIANAPDVIIDIGEAKKTEKEDMDALQQQLRIPVIFVEATLPSMAEAYDILGDITGEKEQARKLSDYCRAEIEKTDKAAVAIPMEDRKSVYFAIGSDGLHTNARGSIHADVIERIGAVNAADVETVSTGGGSQVSFEQLLLWNPDTIIVDSQALYDKITADSLWKELAAVKSGNIFKIPSAPYSFMSSPPSVNRMIGLKWLGNLLYPESYTGDTKEEIKDFYKLFYHISVTDGQLDTILKDSVRK